LFNVGLGGRFGSGRQWQSWITIDDVLRAVQHLFTADVVGAVNLTSPEPVRNAEFTKTLGSVLGRPTMVPVPKFGPSLLLGRDLAEILRSSSLRVVPAHLEASGFEFAHPDLEEALRHVLGRPIAA
jgi:NAD dependent epimerase/dehydratase family enzyme